MYLQFHYHPLLKMLGCRYMLTPVEGGVSAGGAGRGSSCPARPWSGSGPSSRTGTVRSPSWGSRGSTRGGSSSWSGIRTFPRARRPANPGTVRVTESSTDHLTIEADVKAASILVVTDNYTDGWRIVPLAGSASAAYEIIPANYTLRGVPLAPGHHHFRMEYRPASFVIGVWLSLAGVAAWLAVAGCFRLAQAKSRCGRQSATVAPMRGERMTVPVERRGFYICLALAAAALAVYSPVVGFDFVNLDDPLYVYENPHVRAGITPEGIRWAFTNLDANFWHPLTWLSHMLDWQLFGPRAGGHHAMGLLLHVANTLLLFLALARLTSRFWESAAVAALFALHPLHVESVAWVSERKGRAEHVLLHAHAARLPAIRGKPHPGPLPWASSLPMRSASWRSRCS